MFRQHIKKKKIFVLLCKVFCQPKLQFPGSEMGEALRSKEWLLWFCLTGLVDSHWRWVLAHWESRGKEGRAGHRLYFLIFGMEGSVSVSKQIGDKFLRFGAVWHRQFCHFTAVTKHESLKLTFIYATDFLLAVVAWLRGSFQPWNACVEGSCFQTTFWILWDMWDGGEVFFSLVPCSFPRTVVWVSYGNV